MFFVFDVAKVTCFFEINNNFAKNFSKKSFKNKNMKRVLGLGNALLDIMTPLTSDAELAKFGLPKGSMQLVDAAQSQNIMSNTAHTNPRIVSGGSAANTIYGLACLGIPSGFVGKVGNDEFGKMFEEDLRKVGIETFLSKGKDATGKAIALVTPDSERTFATHLGAAIEQTHDDLRDEVFSQFDILHIEGYLVQDHELILQALAYAEANKMTISIDCASYNVVEANRDFFEEIIKRSHIVFANEDEARALTGLEPAEALDKIASWCEVAVVKIGEEGSLIAHKWDVASVGILEVTPVDTTGAGDLYAAGFLYGLINQQSLDKCGLIGSILAGRVIEEMGARIGEERWDAIRAEVAEAVNE
jgi:sugar/nucleoside kinase (ribokinase family)